MDVPARVAPRRFIERKRRVGFIDLLPMGQESRNLNVSALKPEPPVVLLNPQTPLVEDLSNLLHSFVTLKMVQFLVRVLGRGAVGGRRIRIGSPSPAAALERGGTGGSGGSEAVVSEAGARRARRAASGSGRPISVKWRAALAERRRRERGRGTGGVKPWEVGERGVYSRNVTRLLSPRLKPRGSSSLASAVGVQASAQGAGCGRRGRRRPLLAVVAALSSSTPGSRPVPASPPPLAAPPLEWRFDLRRRRPRGPRVRRSLACETPSATCDDFHSLWGPGQESQALVAGQATFWAPVTGLNPL